MTELSLDIPSGVALRTELSLRALTIAKVHGFLCERTDGAVPGVLFGQNDNGCHGNFHPLAYQMIASHRQWKKRLGKPHTAFKRSRARANWHWKELDCAHSSDALLMNIFCHPDVLTFASVRAMLGVESKALPEFGFKPRTPLRDGKRDNTEIDMKIDQLLVEAKLTESNFQSARFDLISRYRDLEIVFDLPELPCRNEKYCSYQLIRGTLAAYSTCCSFCVFCDARRPDLVEAGIESCGRFDFANYATASSCLRGRNWLGCFRTAFSSFWVRNTALFPRNLRRAGYALAPRKHSISLQGKV